MTLQIFERFEPPGQDPFYRVGGSFVPYCTVAKDKRFTDAELAAEYWHAAGDAEAQFFANHEQEDEGLNHVVDTLERFATLPHFDEVEE